MKLFQRMMGNSCPWRYLVYTLTHSTVVIILFLMLWKEFLLKEIQRLKGRRILKDQKG